MRPTDIAQGLLDLEQLYLRNDEWMWMVGGYVRDTLLGIDAKDQDLATTATPDKQIAMLDAAGYRWFGTGLKHGTITVLADGVPYEFTTLRTDVATDGRHAEVAYIRDLPTDLSRRDLTINAIAMTLDGEIIDPFGGVHDAKAGLVRFVGRAEERIAEDYLRIMRWFRFTGRFAHEFDRTTKDFRAIAARAQGLERISVERIWSEIRGILTGTRPAGVIELMRDAGVLQVLDLPEGDTGRLAAMRDHTADPATLMAAWLGDDAVTTLERWKASGAESEAAAYAAGRLSARYGIDEAKRDLVDGQPADRVEVQLRLRRNVEAVRALEAWSVPTFPITGADLKAAGMTQGPAMGETLKALRDRWIASDYAMTRDQLLAA